MVLSHTEVMIKIKFIVRDLLKIWKKRNKKFKITNISKCKRIDKRLFINHRFKKIK